MIIYKVSYQGDGDGHKGYGYFASNRLARIEAKTWEKDTPHHQAPITRLNFPNSKSSILRLLNSHASHNDNG